MKRVLIFVLILILISALLAYLFKKRNPGGENDPANVETLSGAEEQKETSRSGEIDVDPSGAVYCVSKADERKEMFRGRETNVENRQLALDKRRPACYKVFINSEP